MITTQLFLTLFSTFMALQFDFEGGNIEDHIDQKILYLRQFSDDERKVFCENGDHLSCKILFLSHLSRKELNQEKTDFYFSKLPDEHRHTGIYFHITENWRDISFEKLREYMASLPEELSKRLYDKYLLKLYMSGNIKDFMADYRQGRSSELTTYFVRELLKKDPGQALEFLRSLKVNFAENFYDSISKEVEKYSKKLSSENFNEFRIWMLEFNYRKVRYQQAINLADKWYPSKKYSDSFSWRAHLYRAMSHTKKREHEKARAIYKKLEEHYLNEKLNDGDIYKFFHQYGYSEAALGDNLRSIELYLAGYEFFLSKDEESAGSFLYMAADMSRLAENWQSAEDFYTRYLNNYADSDKAGMTKFLLFWINYRQKDFEQAKNILDDIISTSGNMSYDFQRAAYWLARVREKLGSEMEPVSMFCFLSENFPASFYGSMAASRIREKGFTCDLKGKTEQSGKTQKFRDDMMMSETGWILAAMVADNQATTGKVLRTASGTIMEKGAEIDRLTASYCAKTVNNHTLAANLIKSISNFSGTSKDYFKLQYTIAFEEEILSHSDFYGVPPMFVFSIARQESLFSVGAVSTSYAIGLLQLLPSTAQLLANKENYGKISPDVLKKPLTNVRFGIRFLSDLLTIYGGSIPLAAAAYNAGPGRISRWVENKSDMEIDEFIEDIPIFQTRNYVKKVMGNMAVYNYIFENKVYDELEFKLPAK